jgi:predicted phage baseplate assembly protein
MNGASPTAFPPAGSGGCSAAPAAPGIPVAIFNAAGLGAIQYRIGDFTSFRAAMLAAIPRPDLLAGGVTSLLSAVTDIDGAIDVVDSGSFPASAPFRIKIDDEYLEVVHCLTPTSWKVTRGTPAAAHDVDAFVTLVPLNPFANWHEGIAGDYQTMLVELWAYLADVLTFYQERIANEAFLGTASLRDSLLRLVELIDYRPSPGAAASGWAAFTVAVNQSLTVPAGLRIASRPQPGQQPVLFETAAPIAATAAGNSIGLSLLSPDIPFAPQTVVLQGASLGVSVGDYLVVFDGTSSDSATAVLVRVTNVSTDPARGTTTLNWQDTQNQYTQASKHASVYAFRVKAAPFGASAPLWNALSPTLTASSALYPVSWEFRSIPKLAAISSGAGFTIATELDANDWFFLPIPLVPTPGVVLSQGTALEPATQLFLDQVYADLAYSKSNPGLAVLLTDNDVFQVLSVIDKRDMTKTAYGIASPSTRLTFAQNFALHTFPFRGTAVLTGSQLLPLQVELPVPDPVTGASLTLAGIHTELQDGQTVVLTGNLFDDASNSATQTRAAETATLNGAPQPDIANGVTVVHLKQGLANRYAAASCVLSGNVAGITQGETVHDEILGDGAGTAFQSYPLKKPPLTYLPATDSEGLSAVKSTLTVSVNGVAWTEQPDFSTSAPNDQVFVTSTDDAGQTSVLFGDGFRGACPPTGTENIHAHYRSGLGSSGNLPGGAVQQLVDSIANLQKVNNPIPTSGGADPAGPAEIRQSAPGSLQTFGRAVSATDYAALAASYPGIAKAGATWIVEDPATGQVVAHPYVQLTAASVNRVPLQGTSLASNLRRFLDGRRDPNVRLRIQDFTPVYLAVTVQVVINARYPHQATLNRVNAVLNPGVNPDGSLGFFAFERLGFGEPIYLSSLYAAIQAIPGIDNALVTVLARVSPPPADPPSVVPHDILPGPTEVAVIDSNAVPASVLTLIGTGGFAL